MYQGRKIYLDNWYSSPTLFDKLYTRSTNACGTVNVKRKKMLDDKELRNAKKMKVGEMIVRYNKTMSFLVWEDKRVASLLSTMHTPILVPTSKINYKTGEYIKNPKAVIDYN